MMESIGFWAARAIGEVLGVMLLLVLFGAVYLFFAWQASRRKP